MFRLLLALLLLAALFVVAFVRWPTAERESEAEWASVWAYGIVLVDATGKQCFPDLETQLAVLRDISNHLDDQGMPLDEPLFDPGCSFYGPLTSDRTTSTLRIAVTEHATRAKVIAAFAEIGIAVGVKIPADRDAIITIETANYLADGTARVAKLLRTLPHVQDVDTHIVRPEAATTIIHIKDWHFVPFEAFAANVDAKGDELAKLYEQHLDEAEAVQNEQVALLAAMLDHLNVAGVFVEGLTQSDMPVFKIINEVVAKAVAKKGEQAGQRAELRETILRHGAVGQLFRDKKLELERVSPLDDAQAMKAANPVRADGTVQIDKQSNELREDAMVQNLLTTPGVVVVILGGAHDLTDNLKRAGANVAYIQVETRAFSRAAGN